MKQNQKKSHRKCAHAFHALPSLPPKHISPVSEKEKEGKDCALSPVRPLLVQHAVSALLAADGVAALQGDFVVAVAAQVVHRALCVFEAAATGLEAGVGGAGGAEVGLAAGGRGLVLFAGHGGWLEVCVCWCGCWCWLWRVFGGGVAWLVGWLVGCRVGKRWNFFKVEPLSAKHVKEALTELPCPVFQAAGAVQDGFGSARAAGADIAQGGEDRMPILADQTR